MAEEFQLTAHDYVQPQRMNPARRNYK